MKEEHMNSLDKMEDYDRLAKLAQRQAKEIAELSRLKNHFQKNYEDTNKLNWDLGLRLSAASATIVMQAEAWKEVVNSAHMKEILASDQLRQCCKALSASVESVAAWESEHAAKVLEELRSRFNTGHWNQADAVIREIDSAIAEYRATNKEQGK